MDKCVGGVYNLRSLFQKKSGFFYNEEFFINKLDYLLEIRSFELTQNEDRFFTDRDTFTQDDSLRRLEDMLEEGY